MSVPPVAKRFLVWGAVATSLTAIGAALLMGLQLVKPAWAYATLPVRTAAIVTAHSQDITDLKVWRRRKERRDWKTRWYLEQIALKSGIPYAPEPRDRDLDDE